MLFSPIPSYSSGANCLLVDDCPKSGFNWNPSLFQQLTTPSNIVVDDFEKPKREMEKERNKSITDWTTYKDETFEYQIQYPSSWQEDHGQQNSVIFVPPTATEANLGKGSVIVLPNYQNTVVDSVITVEEYAQTTQANLKESLDFEYQSNEINTLGENTFWLARGGCCMDIGMHAYTLRNGNVYRITLSNLEGDITQEELDIFYQILSTFEFTDDGSVEERFCGGIAANLPVNQCPEGYTCKLDNNYPDAGGTCVKQ